MNVYEGFGQIMAKMQPQISLRFIILFLLSSICDFCLGYAIEQQVDCNCSKIPNHSMLERLLEYLSQ